MALLEKATAVEGRLCRHAAPESEKSVVAGKVGVSDRATAQSRYSA